MENNPNGFPRLATFQASDANFGLYRSYSYLHSRILLDYQDEITELEKELDNCDWDDFEEDPERPKVRLAGSDEEGERTRRTVLREIKTKLMEYGTCFAWFELTQLTVTDDVLIKVRTRVLPETV